MVNFINFKQECIYENLRYRKYILYSGENVDRIKAEIVNDIKDEWENEFYKLSEIYSSFSLRSIYRDTNDIINRYIKKGRTKVNMYDLDLYGPYTDIRRAIDFYFEYLSIRQEDENNIMDNTKFIFAGEYEDISDLIGIVNSGALKYLAGFKEEYGISLSDSYIKKITKIISY